jgi:hypothetical protein
MPFKPESLFSRQKTLSLQGQGDEMGTIWHRWESNSDGWTTG